VGSESGYTYHCTQTHTNFFVVLNLGKLINGDLIFAHMYLDTLLFSSNQEQQDPSQVHYSPRGQLLTP